MTLFEMINLHRELIGRMAAAGYKRGDVRYVGLYADYKRMTEAGEKVSYAVAVLSERYCVCERKVYDIIGRFGRNCMFGADDSTPPILVSAPKSRILQPL